MWKPNFSKAKPHYTPAPQTSVNGGERTGVSAAGVYESYGAGDDCGLVPLGTVNLVAGINSIEIYGSGNCGCTVGSVAIEPASAAGRSSLNA